MLKKIDFMTPTAMKVLDLFLSNPMGEFHEMEVVRKAGISKGSANGILRKLAGVNILKREKKGRMVFYRMDAKNPMAKSLKVLGNIWSIEELVNEIKKYSRKIILFGSSAEGTDVEDSDIDMLIITDGKGAVKEAVSLFNSKNARKISPVVLDFGEFSKMRKADPAFYENVDRGIVLWEK